MSLPLQSPGSKYTLLAELGSGGMAVVYLAVLRGQSDFTKLVVLKVLHPFLADNAADREVFLREARLAARLNHPSVVQTYEVAEQEEDGRPMLVMEYLEGKALNFIQQRAWNMARPVGLALQLRIIADTLAGLHYAHELRDFDGTPLQIVHRDVSPHNIFVTFDGQTKILDFGIAKLASSPHDTEVGVRKGKPRYMAREQALGETLDRRCDVFAIGVVLWEAIARRRFWGRRSDFEIVNALSRADPIPPPGSHDPQLDARLEGICLRALAHDRDKRYADCQEFRNELLSFLSEQPVQLSAQEVGNMLCEMFAEFREQQRQLIAQRLSNARVEAPSSARGGSPQSLPSPSGTQALSSGVRPSRAVVPAKVEVTNQTSSYGTYSVRSSVGAIRRSGRLLGIALLVAAVLIVVGVLVGRRSKDKPTVSAVKPRTSVAAPGRFEPPPPTKPQITLVISATPKNARLFLDGKPLESNPAVARLVRDGSRREVRAEAPGYAPKTAQVRLDQSHNLQFSLERVQQVMPAPSAVVPTAETPPAPAVPTHKPRRTLDTENPWAKPAPSAGD